MVTRSSSLLVAISSACSLALGTIDGASPSMPPATGATTPSELRRLIILHDLTSRAGRLRSLTASSISLTLADGRVETTPLRDVIAVCAESPRRPVIDADSPMEAWRDATLSGETPQGLLQLVDGEQLPGLPGSPEAAKPAGADHVAWASRQFGLLSLPLDSVRLLLLRPGAAKPDEASTSDVVHLVNGDRMEGFVSGVGANVGIESQGKAGEIETSRVASIRLANAARPASGAWVWLSSGTICGVTRVTLREDGKGEVATTLPGAAAETVSPIEASDLRAVCFDVTRLKGLASLEMTVEPDQARHWTPPPVIGDASSSPLSAADVELPGPMTVLWNVAGASRTAGEVELPRQSLTWGDCEVVIEYRSAGSTSELWRRRLREGDSQAAFNLSLPAKADGVLAVRLLEGENGPVMDRAVLRRVLVLRP